MKLHGLQSSCDATIAKNSNQQRAGGGRAEQAKIV
jgi:hypothetical protein